MTRQFTRKSSSRETLLSSKLFEMLEERTPKFNSIFQKILNFFPIIDKLVSKKFIIVAPSIDRVSEGLMIELWDVPNNHVDIITIYPYMEDICIGKRRVHIEDMLKHPGPARYASLYIFIMMNPEIARKYHMLIKELMNIIEELKKILPVKSHNRFEISLRFEPNDRVIELFNRMGRILAEIAEIYEDMLNIATTVM